MSKQLKRAGLENFFTEPILKKAAKTTVERQNVPIRKDAHAQLRIIAAKKGVKLQEIIDEAIASFLKKND